MLCFPSVPRAVVAHFCSTKQLNSYCLYWTVATMLYSCSHWRIILWVPNQPWSWAFSWTIQKEENLIFSWKRFVQAPPTPLKLMLMHQAPALGSGPAACCTSVTLLARTLNASPRL
jgi:hypothetical protein